MRRGLGEYGAIAVVVVVCCMGVPQAQDTTLVVSDGWGAPGETGVVIGLRTTAAIRVGARDVPSIGEGSASVRDKIMRRPRPRKAPFMLASAVLGIIRGSAPARRGPAWFHVSGGMPSA
jgi:hypothetical protein